MITPAQLEQQLQTDKLRRSSLISKLQIEKSFLTGTQAPELESIGGLDRLNQQINSTVETVKGKATSEIFGIANTLGIEGLGTSNVTLPSVCPDPVLVQQILQRRTALISQIEASATFINIVDRVLDTILQVISGTETTLNALNLIKISTATASQLLPAVPGAVSAAISYFDDIRTILTFKSDGTPKLPELKRSVNTGAAYVVRAALVFNSILSTLKVIDLFLEKCGVDLGKPSVDLVTLISRGQAVVSSSFETSYKGFTFQVTETPFSPTVNRKIGQALNSQGIVLLETDPSFTTDPQILIEELKLTIDRDNLKAN
jgi:hypothetical protein